MTGSTFDLYVAYSYTIMLIYQGLLDFCEIRYQVKNNLGSSLHVMLIRTLS